MKLFGYEIKREEKMQKRASDPMFGSIANNNPLFPSSVDFIPVDNNGETINLTGDINPQWLGLSTHERQYWAYRYCSPLASVIDRLAEADTNGILEFLNEDGSTVKNVSKIPLLSRIKKLMLRPNPTQTWHEFNAEQDVVCRIHGYCPVLPIIPVGQDASYATMLWNLDPKKVKPIANTNFDMFIEENAYKIKEWVAVINGETLTFNNTDIFVVRDGFISDLDEKLGLPISKVQGLDYFVSNICAAAEADNVLLKKKGPLGVFSYDQKPDMAGLLPMDNDEKNEIQADLAKYGLTWDKLQYVISKVPLRWNAMSFNIRDLMTKETIRQAIDGICDRFGYPAELMSGKNATYENRSSAEKFLYQNNIIPFSLRKMEIYNIFFGLSKTQYKLYMDYNHLPVLQEDILQAGQASKAEAQALEVEWLNGVITWNEWRVKRNMDKVSSMDIYYPEWVEKFGNKKEKI